MSQADTNNTGYSPATEAGEMVSPLDFAEPLKPFYDEANNHTPNVFPDFSSLYPSVIVSPDAALFQTVSSVTIEVMEDEPKSRH